MTKKRLVIVLLVLAAAAVCITFVNTKYPGNSKGFVILNKLQKRNSEPVLAFFSRNDKAELPRAPTFKHYAVTLNNDDRFTLKNDAFFLEDDTTAILLTVEMWGGKYLSKLTSEPLEEIANGKFDAQIKLLCAQLINGRKNIWVRFNPEMEVPVKLYPWQKYAQLYIPAFQRFYRVCKQAAPHAKIIWAPAGYPGALENYPGDGFVDAVSITLRSNSEKYLNVYPKDSIPQEIIRKLHRLRFLDKPVLILGSESVTTLNFDQGWVLKAKNHVLKDTATVYSKENFLRPQPVNEEKNNGFVIGLHDPNLLLVNEKPVAVEHIFSDFGNIQTGLFEKIFNEVLSRGHDVIVTIEPWKDVSGVPDPDVLGNIVKGKYDPILNTLFKTLSTTQNKVYLRFAHEMEIPITRYAWQSKDPVEYIHAFRYFMNFPGKMPENIKKIWGPAGDRGSLEWWPGNDVVDYVSIAIYGLPDKNITDPEKQESFKQIFNRKIWRFRFINKPIFITEFGVKGPEDYQTKWLEAAAQTLNEHNEVIGINYFNMTDTPKAWGNIKPPDWSISKKSFYRFLEVLERDNNP